jgi:predicted transcriptional regulator
MPDNLSAQARRLLSVLRVSGDWMDRVDLANALSKQALSTNDIALLEKMEQMGLIKVRQEEYRTRGQVYEYRAKP